MGLYFVIFQSTIQVGMDDRLMPKSASNGYPPVTPANPCIEEDIVEEEISEDTEAPLVYKISDRPPVHLILFFAFQVSDVQIRISCI